MRKKQTIPKIDEEISVDYLNETLEGFNTITDVKIKPPSTEGGMSFVRIVGLNYKEPLDPKKLSPKSVVVKYLSSPKLSWFDMSLGGHYERELLWYKYYNKNLLKVFYSKLENDTFIIIMENGFLKNDGRVLNQVKESMNLQQMFKTIEKIGELHSKYWHEFEENEKTSIGITVGNQDSFMSELKLNWIPSVFSFCFHCCFGLQEFESYSKKNKIETWSQYSEQNLKKLTDFEELNWKVLYDWILNIDFKNTEYENSNIKEIIEDLNTLDIKGMISNFFTLISEKFPKTILHGDLRSDNLIFDKEDNVSIVDWQCVTFGCGLMDIARITIHSMSIDDLRSNENIILEHYLKQLNDSLENKIEFKTIKEYYKTCILYELHCSIFLACFWKGYLETNEFDKTGEMFSMSMGIIERACTVAHRHYFK
eukprot:gene3931-7141_t